MFRKLFSNENFQRDFYNRAEELLESNLSYENACKVVDEMVKQVGKVEFDDNGMLKKGVVVRHLLLPGMEDDSKKILKYLYETYGDSIYISIMNQYTPIRKCEFEELNSKISDLVYDDVIDYAWDIGIRNAFIQEEGSQSESFIPDFDIFNE